MKNYLIITANNLRDLMNSVNESLEEGYVLQGGPFTSGTFSTMYHQAIVKIPAVREKEVEQRHRSKN